ncbi:MAG: acyl-CoA thioesterase [Pyrinomonadaceae bacterium]
MSFSTRIRVRFGDTDPAGLVYYPNIFHYFHIAMEEFFSNQCGVGYDQLVKAERIGFPTVNIQTEFRSPILYGDEIEIEVFVSRPSRTSAIFEYRVTRVSDGQLCAQSTQIHVAMNLDTRRLVHLPETFRKAFGDDAACHYSFNSKL